MKVNKKHTIYFAIGALGIGFLAFDRVSTPGQEAEAGAITPDAGAASTPSVSAPAAPHTVVPANSAGAPADKNAPGAAAGNGVEEQVADHLDTIAADKRFNLATTREAFVVSPGWSTTRYTGPAAPDQNLAAFKAHHKLNTVVVSDRRSAEAMIDGRLLHVGDDVDGFKIVSITKQGVLFQANGRQVELTFRAAGAEEQQQSPQPLPSPQ